MEQSDTTFDNVIEAMEIQMEFKISDKEYEAIWKILESHFENDER